MIEYPLLPRSVHCFNRSPSLDATVPRSDMTTSVIDYSRYDVTVFLYWVAPSNEAMQGWGSVVGAFFSALAAIVALMIYRLERGTRRLERRDTEAAQARMITVHWEPEQVVADEMVVARCICVNRSSQPIMNLRMTATRAGDFMENNIPRTCTLLSAGEEWSEAWNLVGDLTWRPANSFTEFLDLQVHLDFVDAAGHRWIRVGQEQPRRLLT